MLRGKSGLMSQNWKATQEQGYRRKGYILCGACKDRLGRENTHNKLNRKTAKHIIPAQGEETRIKE